MTEREPAGPQGLPPGAEDRLRRAVALLLGLIPLPDMTDDEVAWVFRQRVRLAD